MMKSKGLMAILLWIALSLILAGAVAETDGSLDQEATAEMNQEQKTEAAQESCIWDVSLSTDYSSATVYYTAEKETTVTLQFYNDYTKPSEKRLICETEPVLLSTQNEEQTIDLSALAAKLPKYFELEAQTKTVDGENGIYATSAYTEAITFVHNATEKDFPKGYYVAINAEGDQAEKTIGLFSADEEIAKNVGYVKGYVAYNHNLILLDGDTPYTIDEEDGTVTFSPVPQKLQMLSEEELLAFPGILLRSEDGLEETIAFLNGGISMDEDSLTMRLAEPESTTSLYEAISLSASSNEYSQTTVLNDEYVEGWISHTPALKFDYDFSVIPPKFNFKVQHGMRGEFSMKIKQATDSSLTELDDDFKSIRRHELPLNIESEDSPLVYGFGYSVGGNIYIAANGAAEISGEYGESVLYTIGTSGVKTERSRNVTHINKILPQEPNQSVIVYIEPEETVKLKGLEVKIPLGFYTIKYGPIFSLETEHSYGERAEATWTINEKQSIGQDQLHICTLEGKKGCISGKTQNIERISNDIEVKVPLYKTFRWTVAETVNVLKDKTTYFTHSLEYDGDKGVTRSVLNQPVTCPYQYERVSVKTMVNSGKPIADAVISGKGISVEQYTDPSTGEQKPISTLTTDQEGVANPVYIQSDVMTNDKLNSNDGTTAANAKSGTTIMAATASGVLIGRAFAGQEEIQNHNQIIIYAENKVVSHINLDSEYLPYGNAASVLVGADVPANDGSSVGYTITCDFENKTVDQKPNMRFSVSWEGNEPQGWEWMQLKGPGVFEGRFKVDLTKACENGDYICISPDVDATIMGSHGENSAENQYHFTITHVSVKDGIGKDGTVYQDAIAEITAEFCLQNEAEDEYVLVNVQNGLSSLSSHFYRRGETAIAISRDMEKRQNAVIHSIETQELIPAINKESLCVEAMRAAAPEGKVFSRWTVSEDSGLTYKRDFKPMVTSSGPDYNLVLFSVPNDPNVKEIILTAVYEDESVVQEKRIQTVYIKSPELVPGQPLESVSQGELYSNLDTEGERNSVSGIAGEESGKVNLNWMAVDGQTGKKIRFNTAYRVTTDVKPVGEYDFLYPLGGGKGTKALMFVSGTGKEFEETDFSLKEQPDTSYFGEATYTVTTRKARLLEIVRPNDLWFREGTAPEVINAELRAINSVAIITEDVEVDNAPVEWTPVTAVPAAGEAIAIHGKVTISEEIDAHGIRTESAVTVHIYGGDELMPPMANPEPGIYDEDISVQLFTVETDAFVEYRKSGEAAFEVYQKPLEFFCAPNEQRSYTIEAKTVREQDGRRTESQTIAYTYILSAKNRTYQLTVIGGSAETASDVGDEIWVNSGEAVTLSPDVQETDDWVFERWEVQEGPAALAWLEGTGSDMANAKFSMPAQDVTIAAVFRPKAGKRLITRIDMALQAPAAGDETLAQADIRTIVTVKRPDGTEEQVEIQTPGTAPLEWYDIVTEGTPIMPVNYGDSLLVCGTYTLQGLIEKAGGRLDEESSFSPSLGANVNGREACLVVCNPDDEKNTALVFQYFQIESETYTLCYDANGGDLGDIPPVTVQLKNKPTALTDKQPTRQDNAVFLGWAETPDAKQPQYTYHPEQPDAYQFNTDTTLYAVWSSYMIEVRWLDADNAKDTRGSFSLTIDGITTQLVSPDNAEEREGVGVQTFELNGLQPLERHTVQVDGAENDVIILTNQAGAQSPYAIEVETATDRAIVTLTAGRILHAQKVWKIDTEGKDRPGSVQVALQQQIVPEIGDIPAIWDSLQTIVLQASNGWEGSFRIVERFAGTIAQQEDGSLRAAWPVNAEGAPTEWIYRIREKAQNQIVEKDKDAIFTVPESITADGKTVEEHQTVYRVSYKEEGDTTTVTNLAVADHVLRKDWVLFGEGAEKPDSVFVALLWKYDESLIDDVPYSVWLPETSPISGPSLTLGDILPDFLEPLIKIVGADKIKLPIAIAKLNEENKWKAEFRVPKYDAQGLPLKHEGAEIWSAACQDALKFFFGIDIPLGINPLEGFASISVPEFQIPLEMKMLDEVINVKISWNDTDPSHVLTGVKTWDDEANQAGKRPNSIQLDIYENSLLDSTKVDTLILMPGESSENLQVQAVEAEGCTMWVWRYRNNQVDRSANTYFAQENVPEGYDATYDGLNVTNSYQGEQEDKILLTGTKTWNDENNKWGKRPTSVTVRLLADGVEQKAYVLNDENCWSWSELWPKKDETGKTIRYTVTEDAVPDYETTINGLNIVNTFKGADKPEPGCDMVKVEKRWLITDAAHPKQSVTMQLLKNGMAYGDPFELNEANDWTATFCDLPKVPDEKSYRWSVLETVPEGFVSEQTREITSYGQRIIVTNKAVSKGEKVLEFTKTWDDENDHAGCRPENVQIQILADSQVIDTQVLTADLDWTWKGTYPEKDEDGQTIAYTVMELPVPNYKVTYSADGLNITNTLNGSSLTLTNTVLGEEKALPFIYSIKLVNAEKQPFNGTLLLRRNGVDELLGFDQNGQADIWLKHGDKLELVGIGQGWTYTVTQKANEHFQTWFVADGTRSSEYQCGPATKNAADEQIDFYNQQLIDILVTKKWEDGENQDGLRPDHVKIALLANGKIVETKLVTAQADWKGVFRQPQTDENDRRILYTVEEEIVPNGYTVSVLETSRGDFVVTNTHEPETVSHTVYKVWDDQNDRAGIRAQYGVQLKADGQDYGTTVLLDANQTSYTWSDLPKHENGGEIVYTVEEVHVPRGYTASVTNDKANSTLTNKYDPDIIETVDLQVKKYWVDQNDEDGLRPDLITVRLFAHRKAGEEGKEVSSITLQAGKWQGSFIGMPKYVRDMGALGSPDDPWDEIVYTIEEDEIFGYTAQSMLMNDGFKLVNTHQQEFTSVTVTKAWKDDGYEERRAAYGLQLYADGVPVGGTVMMNADELIYTWNDLPKYKSGRETVYTVAETVVPKGYTAVVDGYTVTNIYTPQTLCLSVEKVWEGDQESSRPENVTVRLQANGVEVSACVLSKAGNWKDQWTDLPVYVRDAKFPNVTIPAKSDDPWEKITYTLTEDAVTDYTEIVERTGDGFRVTNTYSPSQPTTIDIPVWKVWMDADNQDGQRPENVKIELIASAPEENGLVYEKICDISELNEANHWSCTFKNKPIRNEYGDIIYTVREVKEEALKAYQDTCQPIGNGFVITNMHTPETTSVKVTKTWADEGHTAMRSAFGVQLYANDTPKGETVILQPTETAYTWSNLPKYENGKEIHYTVDEVQVPTGYIKTVTQTADSFAITNTYKPEVRTLSVLKYWADNDNEDGLRPNEITITLVANGMSLQSITKTMTAPSRGEPDEPWTAMFENLPVRVGDAPQAWQLSGDPWQEITYEVEESECKGYEGYLLLDDAAKIINVHIPETTSLTVTKLWNDEGHEAMRVPFGLQLYADEMPIGEPVLVSPQTGSSQTYRFTNLPVYQNGRKITYSVEESFVPPCYKAAGDGKATAQNEYMITNTYEVQKKDIAVHKVWTDGNNVKELRPDSLTVKLIANNTVVRELTLTAAQNWQGVFEGLPVYVRDADQLDPNLDWSGKDDADEIEYTITEEDVQSYDLTECKKTDDGFVLTNTLRMPPRTFTVKKYWDDNGNQDGKRPNSLKVDLLANGKRVETLTLAPDAQDLKADCWTGAFKNLPVFVSDAPTKWGKIGSDPWEVISYSVMEDEKALADSGYELFELLVSQLESKAEITNTYEPETTQITVTKEWKDGGREALRGKYGIRLYKTVGSTTVPAGYVELEPNETAYVWRSLPVYENGQKVIYSVQEEKIPDNYAAEILPTESGYRIINRLISQSISVRKNWEDGDGASRPESVKVSLKADGVVVREITLTAAQNWQGVFENLPVYVRDVGRLNLQLDLSGKDPWDEIEYTITEADVPGYELTTCKRTSSGYELINTLLPAYKTITIQKNWEDGNDLNGKRPDEILIHLLVQNKLVKTMKISKDDWSGSFTDLPVYVRDAQKRWGELSGNPFDKVQYSITEGDIPDYTLQEVVVQQPADTYILTNVLTLPDESIFIEKRWNDGNNQDGKRPDAIEIELLANGRTEPVKAFTLTAENNWRLENITLPALVKDAPDEWHLIGNPYEKIQYEVHEKEVKDYQTQYAKVTGGFVVTNTYVPETTSITMTKVWEDEEREELRRPYYVQLYKAVEQDEPVSVGESVKLNPDELTYTWSNLPTYEAGKKLTYTVRETFIPWGYDAQIEPTTDGVRIVNTYAFTDIMVCTDWLDDEDRDGMRPTEFTVHLYADGIEAAKMVLQKESGWTGTFWDLPVYTDEEATQAVRTAGTRKTIDYTLRVDDIPAYTWSVEPTVRGFSVTNRHAPATANISVTKVWRDGENKYGYRPRAITVNLMADGRLADTLTLSADENWSGMFANYPVYDHGKRISYSVSENTVDRYKMRLEGSAESGFVLTNTLTYGYDIHFYKVWQDNLKTHQTPQFILYNADGTIHRDISQPPRNMGNGHYVYSVMEPGEYYVMEVPIAGYHTEYTNIDSSVTDRVLNGGTITNIKIEDVPETGDPFNPLGNILLLVSSVIGLVWVRKRWHE